MRDSLKLRVDHICAVISPTSCYCRAIVVVIQDQRKNEETSALYFASHSCYVSRKAIRTITGENSPFPSPRLAASTACMLAFPGAARCISQSISVHCSYRSPPRAPPFLSRWYNALYDPRSCNPH